ncbi:MAG: hypothetical protein M3430_03780 [Acidobacteriota bacterium]|nr:hypothetical protein [Acidobacteriota bacterium]
MTEHTQFGMSVESTRRARRIAPRVANSLAASVMLSCLVLFCFALPVAAQAPAPPTTDGVERITEVASNFVPTVKSIVESLMLKRFVWLATIFAQLVMAASFLKLMSEKMGPTKDLFGWIARCLIFLPLIISGPFIVTYLWKVGQVLTNPLDQPTKEIRRSFEERYWAYVEGHFIVDGNGTPYEWIAPTGDGREALVGVLKSDVGTVKTVEEMLSDDKENMPTLFALVSWARGIISFADFLLIIMGGLLMIAFRLAVPWMLAVAIDKSLAHEITYRFARGVIVFTLIFPVVSNIMRIIAYLIGLVGMSAYDRAAFTVLPNTIQVIPVDPSYNTTFTIAVAGFMMLVSSLCLLASPVISWKIAFGQTFEGVATVASGWMAAVVGSGINLVSAKVGAALNNAAERLTVQSHADAGLINARAETGYTKSVNNIGLQKELTGIGANARLHRTLNNAGAAQQITNVYAGLKQEIMGYEAGRNAQQQNINTDGFQTRAGASVATSREQAQALLNYDTGSRTNEQRWWTLGSEAAGGVAGAAVSARTGGKASMDGRSGQNIGSIAQRPAEIYAEGANIEQQRDGLVGISNQTLVQSNNNTNAVVEMRRDTEDERFATLSGAATERAGAAVGAVESWRGQANAAATRYQGEVSGAAQTATSGLNLAADVKLGESERSIETVRAAGMGAAEYHRMAQILGQITHDMTRRIEEMGQYRF